MKNLVFFLPLFLHVIGSSFFNSNPTSNYLVGSGIADITGLVAEINMMGYAKQSQNAQGLHQRLYSRAFLFENDEAVIAFVSIDSGMVSNGIKEAVVALLNKKYGQRYRMDNLCISSTHTHAGPGGFLEYMLYHFTNLGYIKEQAEAMINGIYMSIVKAHENMQRGYVLLNEGELMDASINRSPFSYLQNPEEERAKYAHNTDKTMTLLKIMGEGNVIGSINWFALHAVSMNNTNKLISGDNKGYASYLLEKSVNGVDELVGRGSFVAAFAQSNEGDVTPNILGSFCIDTGEPCDLITSTCNGRSQNCIGRGPGWHVSLDESTRILGERQFIKAKELYDKAHLLLEGKIASRMKFIDISNQVVFVNGVEKKTCKSAFGFSFAAGTTDGPGEFDFTQGNNSTSQNPIWNLARDFLAKPSKEQIECHLPKPILLNAGETKRPYPWLPSIVPIQILRLVAGRRLVDAVKKRVISHEPSLEKEAKFVIAGLSNTYASYVTTFEEYQVQRYEGASTLFGPHTLQAYIERFLDLVDDFYVSRPGNSVEPPRFLDSVWRLLPPVVVDNSLPGKPFGFCLIQPSSPSYSMGDEVVVDFQASNPRSKLEGSFLFVEMYDQERNLWNVVRTDADWSTKFYWKYTFKAAGVSRVRIVWKIEDYTKKGVYRIVYQGNHKTLTGGIKSHRGTSNSFKVE